MARRWAGALLCIGMAGALAACGLPRYSRDWAEPRTARAFWSYAGAGQPFLIEVHNPPPPVTAEGLAAAFPSPPTVAPAARFTADAASAARPEYRFVLMFGAPNTADGDDACAGAAARLKGGEALQAAFCYRDRALAEVRVEALGDAFVGGAGTAEVRKILYGISRYLVPPPEYDPSDQPDLPPI